MIFDALDANALQPKEIDLREKLEKLNSCFDTRVTPENGYYGIREIDKGNGLTVVIGKNGEGHRYMDYLSDGHLYKRRINLGNHELATYAYDDRGTAYMRTVNRLADNKCRMTEISLERNVKVTLGNFHAETDSLGRPIYNKITDLQLKEPGAPRQYLSDSLRDSSYKMKNGQYLDHRGHLIPDQFGGPASKLNVVAQFDEVNLKRVREVERYVEQLKNEGHSVDYSMKSNYIGTNGRPTSFEPKITYDGGKVFELPPELQKIYNGAEGSKILNAPRHALVDLGEKLNPEGLTAGIEAAKITFVVSTVTSVTAFLDGRITAEEMVTDITGETALAGLAGYASAVVSSEVAKTMSHSCSELIKKIGGSSVPAHVVSFAVESFGDIVDFAQGEIDASELAYNLGENAATIAGYAGGSAAVAAVLAGVALPAAAGSAAVLVGGIVGCMVAAEVYATAVELGSEGVEALADVVETYAQTTIEQVREIAPDQVDNLREAFNLFFALHMLPCSV